MGRILGYQQTLNLVILLTTTLTKENYQVGAKEISVTRERVN